MVKTHAVMRMQISSLKTNLGIVAAIYPTLAWNPFCALVTKYWKVTPLLEPDIASIVMRFSIMIAVWILWTLFMNIISLAVHDDFILL